MILKNLKFFLSSFFIVGMMLVYVPTAAAVNGQSFKDWHGSCEIAPNNRQVCFLEQSVVQQGQLLMRAVLGYAPGRPQPTVFFELPPGIDIRSGVVLQVDRKKPIRFQGRCSAAMCTAGFVLQGPAKKQFLKGRRATLSYMPAQGGQAVNLPVSLMGVTAGLKALR